MKKFDTPILDVIIFDDCNLITTSGDPTPDPEQLKAAYSDCLKDVD